MCEPNTENMDDLFRIGRYHAVYLFIWQMEFITSSWGQMAVLFYSGVQPTHIYCEHEQRNVPYAQACDWIRQGACTQRHILSDSYEFYSPIVEWNLICDEYTMYYTMATAQMLGVLVGAPLAGWLSDKYGRKHIMLCFLAVLNLAGLCSGLTVSVNTFYISRFFCGFGIAGVSSCSFILLSESLCTQQRLWVRAVGGVPLAVILLSFVVPQIGNWRAVTIWLSLLSIPVMLLLAMVVVESPRWLVQRGLITNAKSNLRLIVHSWNGRQHINTDAVVDYSLIEQEKQGLSPADGVVTDYWFKHLFQTRQLSKYTVVMVLFWCTISLIAYGNQINAVRLSGSVFTNTLILGCLRLLSSLMMVFFDNMFKSCGRRTIKIFCMGPLIVLSASIALFEILEQYVEVPTYGSWIRWSNLLVGFFVNPCWTVAYIMTAELYPTPVRNLANGFCSLFARVGSTMAPMLLAVGTLDWAPLPFIIMAICGIFELTVFCLVIPETKGKPLPEVMPTAAGHRRRPSDVDSSVFDSLLESCD